MLAPLLEELVLLPGLVGLLTLTVVRCSAIRAFRDMFRRAYSRRLALDHASGPAEIARRSIAGWPQNRPFSAYVHLIDGTLK